MKKPPDRQALDERVFKAKSARLRRTLIAMDPHKGKYLGNLPAFRDELRRRAIPNDPSRRVWKCEYCSEMISISDVSLDHEDPRSTGGLTNWANLAVCCLTCNRRKGALWSDEYRALLKLVREEFTLSSAGDFWTRLTSKERFWTKRK